MRVMIRARRPFAVLVIVLVSAAIGGCGDVTNRSFHGGLQPGHNDFDIGLLPGEYQVQVLHKDPHLSGGTQPFSLSGYLVVAEEKVVLQPAFATDLSGNDCEYDGTIIVPSVGKRANRLAKVTIRLDVDPDAHDIVIYIWRPKK